MYIFKLMATIHGEHGMIAQKHVDQVPELELKMCASLTKTVAYHVRRQLQQRRKLKHASLWIAPVSIIIWKLWYQVK